MSNLRTTAMRGALAIAITLTGAGCSPASEQATSVPLLRLDKAGVEAFNWSELENLDLYKAATVPAADRQISPTTGWRRERVAPFPLDGVPFDAAFAVKLDDPTQRKLTLSRSTRIDPAECARFRSAFIGVYGQPQQTHADKWTEPGDEGAFDVADDFVRWTLADTVVSFRCRTIGSFTPPTMMSLELERAGREGPLPMPRR